MDFAGLLTAVKAAGPLIMTAVAISTGIIIFIPGFPR